jgi:hypothetical protein
MPKQKHVPRCVKSSHRQKGVPSTELQSVPEENPIDETAYQSGSGAQASRLSVVKRTGRKSGYSELACALPDGGEEFFSEFPLSPAEGDGSVQNETPDNSFESAEAVSPNDSTDWITATLPRGESPPLRLATRRLVQRPRRVVHRPRRLVQRPRRRFRDLTRRKKRWQGHVRK